VVAQFETPVREYASKTLISVPPEAPLDEVAALLEDRDISAVPVVDASGSLVGVLSTTDLLRLARVEISSPRGRAKVAASAQRVSDVMKTAVVSVDEGAPIRDAAAAMVSHRIHRVVVTRKGKAVGVVSARDAMRAVLFHHVEAPIEKVMTTPVETIDLGEPIEVAVGRLADANVRGLVVVDDGWPVGVFTHGEALRCRALPEALLRTPLEEVMSYEMFCLDVKTPLYRAAGHASQMRVRRILAVSNRKLCGIVTGFDLVRVMTRDDL
jgi:predicted transcriptional regulator